MNIKSYKTTDELIQILKDKNIKFSQPKRAKRLLQENNYYVISGYRALFYARDKTLLPNVDFEHLIRIHDFDKKFKITILKHLLAIEQKVKATISDQISSRYGIKETDYLCQNNYDTTNSHVNDTLNNIKNQIKKYGDKNKAVKHFKTMHGFTPFWVISKCLTMGCIRDYYNILKPKDADEIAKQIFSKNITKKRVNKLKNIIALLTDIRNMCAHDEILIGFCHNRIDIGCYDELNHLAINRTPEGAAIQGRKDLLAVFISIKYLVNRTMFNEFIHEMISLINKCKRDLDGIVTDVKLLSYIGLPLDYEKLKSLK